MDGNEQGIAERQVTIAARDGYPLAATLVVPRAPTSALMVSSGTGFPRGFYLKFAHAAAARGFAVVVYDYRGMGGSAPPTLRGFGGKISDWPRLDMPAVLDFLEREFPGLPLRIVGHSVGAQTVGLIPGIERVSRIAMVAGSTGYWRWHPMPYRLAAISLWFLYGPLTVATVVVGGQDCGVSADGDSTKQEVRVGALESLRATSVETRCRLFVIGLL